MLNVDNAAIVLLVEVVNIGAELAAIEERFGTSADLQDARRRQERLCACVLERASHRFVNTKGLEIVH